MIVGYRIDLRRLDLRKLAQWKARKRPKGSAYLQRSERPDRNSPKPSPTLLRTFAAQLKFRS